MDRLMREWYRGAVCTLGVLWDYSDDTVVYDQIIENYNPDELIEVARKDGNMRQSGLSGYLKRQKAQTR
jgi:hypothetical protein